MGGGDDTYKQTMLHIYLGLGFLMFALEVIYDLEGGPSNETLAGDSPHGPGDTPSFELECQPCSHCSIPDIWPWGSIFLPVAALDQTKDVGPGGQHMVEESWAQRRGQRMAHAGKAWMIFNHCCNMVIWAYTWPGSSWRPSAC